MKTKQQYAQELTDLMVDLKEAIENENEEKVEELTSVALLILDDISEAEF